VAYKRYSEIKNAWDRGNPVRLTTLYYQTKTDVRFASTAVSFSLLINCICRKEIKRVLWYGGERRVPSPLNFQLT
jgi:hypothetical protein